MFEPPGNRPSTAPVPVGSDLANAARALAEMAVAGIDDGSLLQLVGVLEEARRLVELADAAVLAEVDRRGLCDRAFGLSTHAWVAREHRCDARRVRRDVKAGRCLASLGEVRAAVASGAMTMAHAGALAAASNPRVADGLEAAQGALVELADEVGFWRWSQELRGVVEQLDQDGGHDPQRDGPDQALQVTKTFDGALHLAGVLFGADAEAARAALEAKADELFARRSRDAAVAGDLGVPPRSALMAEAFVELCLTGAVVPAGSGRLPRPEATVVINAHDPTVATDPWGVRLADGTTRRLTCDADLFAVVVDSLGVPIDLGRRARLAGPHQRRAMSVRDGGCVFPGCDLPGGWCDAHHVRPWGDGGRTDVSAMASLCRHHHGVTYRTGWGMHDTDDGWFWWRTPSGDTFWSQRHGRQRAGPPPAHHEPLAATRTVRAPDAARPRRPHLSGSQRAAPSPRFDDGGATDPIAVSSSRYG